jgi:hypothetical protein
MPDLISQSQIDALNRMCGVASSVGLGDVLKGISDQVSEQSTVVSNLAPVETLDAEKASGVGAKAVLDTGSVVNNNGLHWAAKVEGTYGNLYSVEIIVEGTETSFSVEFTDLTFTITCATDDAGLCTTTAADILAAPLPNYIFDVVTLGESTGVGVLEALPRTFLTGGKNEGVPSKTEFDALVDLANEIKTNFNALITPTE